MPGLRGGESAGVHHRRFGRHAAAWLVTLCPACHATNPLVLADFAAIDAWRLYGPEHLPKFQRTNESVVADVAENTLGHVLEIGHSIGSSRRSRRRTCRRRSPTAGR